MSGEVTEVPPAEPEGNFLFPGMEVKVLNCGTELVFSGHIEVLGSIVKHSLWGVNSIDFVAREQSIQDWEVPADAVHATSHGPSLVLGLMVEVFGQDSLEEV